MWLQCQENVFIELVKKAISLNYEVELTPKTYETHIQEVDDPTSNLKVKKMTRVATGYVEQGYMGWYLVELSTEVFNILKEGVDLQAHIIVTESTRLVTKVDKHREYVYFRLIDDKLITVNNFTQHFTIKETI